MTDPFLIVRRFPYEEPHNTQLEFTVSNGAFSGRVDIYCDVMDMAEIGQGLRGFPRKIGDEYRYEYGSNDPTVRVYRYFLLHAYTTNRVGGCALQFAIDLNESEPNEGACKFSFGVEPVAIDRLGQLFERFSELKHLELRWGRNAGELYEAYQY